MLKFLPGPVRGVLSLAGYTLNTVFWCLLLFTVAFLKFVVPLRPWRRVCSRILEGPIVGGWIGMNTLNQRLFCGTCLEVDGGDDLDPREWYLVVANHQSWVDILVLQRVFYRKIPMLKFFLKKELIWVPILGLAWWALEFPFMKRYSQQFLRKHPHLAGKDIDITRKACRKFKNTPVSIMNFVEGTRFTERKHRNQKSPHTNLLRPKAGGIALVMGAMGDQLQRIIDVTIVYSGGVKSFWEFVCGNVEEIKVRIRTLPIDPELIGDYARDEAYRLRFQKWLNRLWEEKDAGISDMLTSSQAFPARPSIEQPAPVSGQGISALQQSVQAPGRKRTPPTEGF